MGVADRLAGTGEDLVVIFGEQGRIRIEPFESMGLEGLEGYSSGIERLVLVADGVVAVVSGDHRDEPVIQGGDHPVAVRAFLDHIAQADDALCALSDQQRAGPLQGAEIGVDVRDHTDPQPAQSPAVLYMMDSRR